MHTDRAREYGLGTARKQVVSPSCRTHAPATQHNDARRYVEGTRKPDIDMEKQLENTDGSCGNTGSGRTPMSWFDIAS